MSRNKPRIHSSLRSIASLSCQYWLLRKEPCPGPRLIFDCSRDQVLLKDLLGGKFSYLKARFCRYLWDLVIQIILMFLLLFSKPQSL